MKEMPRRGEQTDLLVRALLAVKTPEECYRLLDDLCTIQEVRALAQRIQVARMLRGRVTYQEIAGETGASTATIIRVNRCLLYGADGYQIVLDRMEKEDA